MTPFAEEQAAAQAREQPRDPAIRRLLVQEIRDQYRIYTLMLPYVQSPADLSTQTIFPVLPYIDQLLNKFVNHFACGPKHCQN